ncbi:hypothetical protein Pcinc_021900 [Petrolisthes cinctipes]|uniref:Mannosyltransferase n=1 Tax=Petrolisthes cinctipes TaxID=88211 RepID=A0AAE1KEF2_PETCI|nr:hypothetical protein Pcinc_021900 [Petrolisthes cinctipes]
MECANKNKHKISSKYGFPRVATKVRIRDSAVLWVLLACARLYLATVQTGYIHPDEFHQSLQVMAGDMLNIDAKRPWEFKSDTPIRSVTFSALVSLPFLVLKSLAPLVSSTLGYDLLSPRVLLVAPRIFMTLFSFLADYSVYRAARLCYLRPWTCVEVFASSYVMLVYATRTLSNTVELVLMAVVIWRVCESMVDSTKVIRKDNILKDLYENVSSVQERVRVARMRSRLPTYNYVDSALLSVLVTYGIFVRPTFLVYSFVPLAFWLQRGVVTKELDFSHFNLRCLSLLPGIFITFIICVLADSFYYGSITFTELVHWNVTGHSFVITPFNFLLYNSKQNNLAVHGLHPYYLHLAVNIPLLHGILGILGLYTVSRYITSFIIHNMTRKPRVSSIATMLLASFIVPVLILSVVPHQEPRFLLPTLPPLVLIHADSVVILSARRIKATQHLAFLTWHVWNILCVVFFGFLHQGGVTKTMLQVHQHSLQMPPHTNTHVIFSRLYSPPTYLLAQQLGVVAETEGHKYLMTRSIFAYDAGGRQPVESLHQLAAKIHYQALSNSSRGAEVVVCLPASVSGELFSTQPAQIKLRLLHRIRGHLTLEDPPDLSLATIPVTESCSHLCQFMRRLDQFSVDIISVEFDKVEADHPDEGLLPTLHNIHTQNTSLRKDGEL